MSKRPVKARFKPPTSAEKQFYRQLKKVAEASGHIVETHTDGVKLRNQEAMQRQLKEYSEAIGPWAERQSARLLEDINKKNKRTFKTSSKKMAQLLKAQIGGQESGEVFLLTNAILHEQVGLIKSIPLESGARAQKLALEAILEGQRAVPDKSIIDDIKKQLGVSTEVARSRAMLIARTETARANSAITQARATSVGAKAYIWRATMDGATRPSHAKMNGKVVLYDKPPTVDGMTGHAGSFPNCRCYQDPVLDEE